MKQVNQLRINLFKGYFSVSLSLTVKIKFILMKGLGHTLIDKTVTDQELLDGIADVLDAEK